MHLHNEQKKKLTFASKYGDICDLFFQGILNIFSALINHETLITRTRFSSSVAIDTRL